MSTLKTTNLQHASAASPAIVLASDGTATAQLSSLNGQAFATNRIINGDMRIDQRNAGASVANAGGADTYFIDRWHMFGAGVSKMTGQRSTVAPTGFTNSALVTSSAATTPASSDAYGLRHKIEGFNFADFNYGSAQAVTFTISFWVRSSISGTYSLACFNSAHSRAYIATYSISSANTWEYKTLAIPGDVSGTWIADNGIGLNCWWDLGSGTGFNGTANSWSGTSLLRTSGSVNWVGTNGATFYITGVQLEAGSVATPYERRSYGQELALCQRYYAEIDGEFRHDGSLGGANISVGHMWYTKAIMRATATVTVKTEVGSNCNNIASITVKSNEGAMAVWEWTNGTSVVTRTKAAVLKFSAEL